MSGLHDYLTFLLTTSLLMLLPGPNVALIVANSVAHGSRYGLLTVLGTSTAMIIQLALTGVGMTAVLDQLVTCFGLVRWLGVLYLVYLGLRQWLAEPINLRRVPADPKSARWIYLRGFLVSLTNPKTLLFFVAFLPQFVSPGRRASEQLWVLSLSFLAIALCFDCAWAVLAARARRFLGKARRRNQVGGSFLIVAALGLALARRK